MDYRETLRACVYKGLRYYYECKADDENDRIVVTVSKITFEKIGISKDVFVAAKDLPTTKKHCIDLDGRLRNMAKKSYIPKLRKGVVTFQKKAMLNSVSTNIATRITWNISGMIFHAFDFRTKKNDPTENVEVSPKNNSETPAENGEISPKNNSETSFQSMEEVSSESQSTANTQPEITLVPFPLNDLKFLLKFCQEKDLIGLITQTREKAETAQDTHISKFLTYLAGVSKNSSEGKLIAGNCSFGSIMSLLSRGTSRGGRELFNFLRADKSNEEALKNSGAFGLAMISILNLQKYLNRFYIQPENMFLDYTSLILSILVDVELCNYLKNEENINTLAEVLDSLKLKGLAIDSIKELITLLNSLQILTIKHSEKNLINSSTKLSILIATIISEDRSGLIIELETALNLVRKIEYFIQIFTNPDPYPLQCLLNSLENPSEKYQLNEKEKQNFHNCKQKFETYQDTSLGIFGPLLVSVPLQFQINTRNLENFIFNSASSSEISKKKTKEIFTSFEKCAFEDFSFNNSKFHNMLFDNTYFKKCRFDDAIFSGLINFKNVYMCLETAASFKNALTKSLKNPEIYLHIIGMETIRIIANDQSENNTIVIDDEIAKYIKNQDSKKPTENQIANQDEIHIPLDTGSDSESEPVNSVASPSNILWGLGEMAVNFAAIAAQTAAGAAQTIAGGVTGYSNNPEKTSNDIQIDNTNEQIKDVQRETEWQNEIRTLENKMMLLQKELIEIRKENHIQNVITLESQINEQQQKISAIEEELEHSRPQRILKEKIASEQRRLLEHSAPQIKLFYQTVLSNLCSIFQSIALVNTHAPLIKPSLGVATATSNNVKEKMKFFESKSVKKGMSKAGGYTAEALDIVKPLAELIPLEAVPTIVTTSINTVVNASDRHKIAKTIEVFRGLTGKEMEKVIDALSRKITFSYEEQILLLSKKGAIKFAINACQCIVGALFNGQFKNQDNLVTDAWLSLRELKNAHNDRLPFVKLSIPFTHQSLKGIEKGKTFQANDLFHHSGIAVIDGDNRYLCESQKREIPEKFGYFRISKEELKYFPKHSDKKSLASPGNSAPAQSLDGNRISKLGETDPGHLAFHNQEEIELLSLRIKALEEKEKKRRIQADAEMEAFKEALRKATETNSKIIDKKPLVSRPSIPAPQFSSSFVQNLTKRPNLLPITIGFKNIGNSCYMNASLQIIRNIPFLCEFIKKAGEDKQNKDEIAKSLYTLFYSNKDNDPNEQSDHLKKVRNAIHKDYRMGHLEGQQDAHECLGYILNHLKFDSSKIEIFKHIETKSPNLGSKNYQKESYNILSVSMTEKSSTLQELLDNEFKPQLLNSTENKDKLKFDDNLVDEWEETQKILNLSDYLIIQLKRFSHDKDSSIEKINTEIEFPEDETGIVISLQENETPVKYQIVSYINHIGKTLNEGHYIAYTRADKEKQWNQYDDHSVQPLDPKEKSKRPGQEKYNTKQDAYIIVLKKSV